MKIPHDVPRRTPGWLLATLTASSFLIILGTGCSSTSVDETELSDVEVTVPSQAEANASASHEITAANADAELQRIDDEVAADKY